MMINFLKDPFFLFTKKHFRYRKVLFSIAFSKKDLCSLDYPGYLNTNSNS